MTARFNKWKKNRNGKGKPRDQGTEGNYKSITVTEKSNAMFERYYRAQNLFGADNDTEFSAFLSQLQVILPTAFRITGNRSHALELRAQIERDFIPYIQAAEVDGVLVEPPKPIPWYPGGFGWQMTVPRIALKKSESLKKFHTFLVTETEVGNISRQETVSMIPPLLLDVHPGQRIIDMCAAPGSKTAQILEALHAEDASDGPVDRGLVIANDANLKRACMLVHQTKRLHSPCLLVTHQDAEQMSNVLYPTKPEDPTYGEPARFDRILCDVPCSGDGTIRKNLLIWNDWKIADGLGLHTVQVKIAQRAAVLLQVGGRMVYSTCSFNPIENEAVVAELINSTEGAMQLVDVSDQLPGLIRRPGLPTWKVMRKDGEFVDQYADFMTETTARSHNKYPCSVFPPANAADLHLERCIRIYPQLQNTGGFFVAVLEKIRPLSKRDRKTPQENPADVTPEPVAAIPEPTETEQPSKRVKLDTDEAEVDPAPPTTTSEHPDAKPLKDDPFIFVSGDDPDVESIWKFFELAPGFPRDQFLVRSEASKQRTLYLVSSDIKAVMGIKRNERMRVVNTGIKCFGRNDIENTPCNYRIHSEALPLVYPFLGDARKVKLLHSDLRILLEAAGHVSIDKFSPALSERSAGMDLGCCIGTLDPADAPVGHTMVAPMQFPIWRGVSSLNILLNKKDKDSLQARVFGPNFTVEAEAEPTAAAEKTV
ncbi:tRNA (cytosine-5-)-methyltransferase ncl1 [Tieghemiomyces parasiticus]|uniref:tRNA (Cytosine-5-)-methyltransferase ncl1 n=1 Tax=Tieghemiomyces parasiticus TaxID=78921 RepID=A0A9W8AE41_9FUNG|nr:tRNA (cytosine-5-)-methyltransferase ncl1 [Tieghemiomyces parasiticus]